MTNVTAVREDIYIDIADLPPSMRDHGRRTGRTNKLRHIPEGRALFIPADGEPLRKVNARISSTASSGTLKALARRYRTRIDNDRDGVWVWWELKS